ncbi:hypothetical protein L1987_48931 [Smallanthus sonchifolius]|uniref:Uncharacterized protein n=1 Tax=Smallanthus sonchifolius TaxID=185202 RepID=A0ACB9FUB4_9ASTR|nr:hypothetical protein L1987_48931 [Smallanthus sonchifolius]
MTSHPMAEIRRLSRLMVRIAVAGGPGQRRHWWSKVVQATDPHSINIPSTSPKSISSIFIHLSSNNLLLVIALDEVKHGGREECDR